MKRKIMVVDDSKFTRTMVGMPLGKAGYDVRSVGDPHEAIGMLSDERPDLIISDLKMPTLMDGLGFLQMVALETKDLPVLVYTADPGAKEAIADIGLDRVDLMVKPVAPHDLIAKIQELLGP